MPKNGAVVDILVQWDMPGTWMLHCQTLDHMDKGMMMQVNISE